VCKLRAKLSQKQIDELRKSEIDIDFNNIFQEAGCEYCRYTGYRGRIGIFDTVPMDDMLKCGLENESLPVAQLRKEGDKRGKYKLQKEGLKKVAAGITSLEELYRVLG
jgi:general secretion pathway protein E